MKQLIYDINSKNYFLFELHCGSVDGLSRMYARIRDHGGIVQGEKVVRAHGVSPVFDLSILIPLEKLEEFNNLIF